MPITTVVGDHRCSLMNLIFFHMMKTTRIQPVVHETNIHSPEGRLKFHVHPGIMAKARRAFHCRMTTTFYRKRCLDLLLYAPCAQHWIVHCGSTRQLAQSICCSQRDLSSCKAIILSTMVYRETFARDALGKCELADLKLVPPAPIWTKLVHTGKFKSCLYK